MQALTPEEEVAKAERKALKATATLTPEELEVKVARAALAARHLEKKTRRFSDFFCARPFLFPRVRPRLTR